MSGLTDDGSRIVTAEVHIHRPRNAPPAEPDDAFDEAYAIGATAAYICQVGAKRAALQLPDTMLPDAGRLYRRLQREVPNDVLLYILGDTTFAACCVDEVAAEHTSADLLLHYGPACFTASVARLPTRHVLPWRSLDVAECHARLRAFRDRCRTAGLRGAVLACDAAYYRRLPELWAAWAGPDAVDTTASLDDGRTLHPTFRPTNRAVEGVVVAMLASPDPPPDGHRWVALGGMHYALPLDAEPTDYGLFCVADTESPAMQQVILHAQFIATGQHHDLQAVLEVYPDGGGVSDESAALSRRLRRRSFLIEKVKEATLVGIVVASLSIAGYQELVERLQHLLGVMGRKSAVLMVGKLNVAKLANFDQIDLFVLVACPGNTLVDDKEFVKPVVTPLELLLGLQALTARPPEFVALHCGLSLSELLTHPFLVDPAPYLEGAPASDISLASGRAVSGLRPAPAPAVDAGNLPVATRAEWAVISQASPAFERLHQQRYQGLDPEQAPCTELQMGLAGLASGYTSEPPLPPPSS